MNTNLPSKFRISSEADDDEIWQRILDTLSEKEKDLANRVVSEISEPYPGAKEIIVKENDKSNIAIATLSEVNGSESEWAVYKERN